MEHNIKLIETRELTDDHISFLFRCCDDPSTDSWCTVSLSLSEKESTDAVHGHTVKMAGLHERKSSFRKGEHLLSIVSEVKVTV